MKVISPAGIEHVFNDANYAERSTSYTDLYKSANKTGWIAQVPNSWMIVNGKYDAAIDHNMTPVKASAYIKENFYRLSSWDKRDFLRFFQKFSIRTLERKK